MLKNILLYSLMLFCISTANASNADYFAVDEAVIQQELRQLTMLESIVLSKPYEAGISNEKINYSLLSGAKDSLDINDHLLGIPSFWWGFGGGFLGGASCYGTGTLGLGAVGYVYWVTDSKKEATQALLGCIAGTAAGLAACLGIYSYLVYIGSY